MLKRSVCLILMMAGLAVQPALSAVPGPAWASKPYKYIVIDQDVRSALIEFGRNMNLPTRISPAVGAQRIRGPIAKQDMTAGDFLQWICDTDGLVWYFDGAVLHIASESEVKTELIRLDGVNAETLMRRIDGLALADQRFNVRVAEDRTALVVSGPPAYRGLIKEAVASLQGGMRAAREVKLDDSARVRVFRGGS